MIKERQVITATIWMIGFPNELNLSSLILMVVREAVPLLDLTVLLATMMTSSTATPQDSAFTRIWFAMGILIQAVEEMMKALIIAMLFTTRRGLSRDMQH